MDRKGQSWEYNLSLLTIFWFTFTLLYPNSKSKFFKNYIYCVCVFTFTHTHAPVPECVCIMMCVEVSCRSGFPPQHVNAGDRALSGWQAAP